MKNRFIVIYTVFAAAVFIFSIGFFGYNLFNEYSTNLKKSENKFTELVNDIRTLSYSQDDNNSTYIQGIKKSINDPSAYSFIQVRRNNETVVLYPTGKSKEETISKLVKTYTSSLTVNKQTVTVDCNIYLIKPDSIFYYARISFLMILIITIITIIMIIYLSLTESTSEVISFEEETNEEDEKNEYEIEKEAVEDEEENKVTENEIADENFSSESIDNSDITETEVVSEDASSEENDNSINSTASEENEEIKSSEVTPEEVQAILAEPLTDEQAEAAAEPAKLPVDEVKPAEFSTTSDNENEPSGLFDPETGIGWESYLSTRLNNEIDRATASEIDLSLFIIKLNSIEKSSETFKNVCNYLGIQFQFKDLLFEYKEDCIVAIKISMGVDEALNLATKLYTDISNIVENKNTRIGISSRSIRMVTGNRLILEAEQAIEHSEESSPVIAFRVDSEKYRQLMEQNKN